VLFGLELDVEKRRNIGEDDHHHGGLPTSSYEFLRLLTAMRTALGAPPRGDAPRIIMRAW
jgi:hypothetical protein